jgi:serine/arginine repetitive matrix protein 2
MYNNIGLLTPRGSGTSGHVTANSFNIRPQQRVTERKNDNNSAPIIRTADEKILHHQRKRAIEVKLADLEEALEEQGYGAEHVNRSLRYLLHECRALIQ